MSAPGGLRDAAEGRLPYPVLTGAGALASLGAVVRAHAPAHRVVLVTDTAVAGHHGAAARAALGAAVGDPLVLTIPPGEGEKTRARWAELTDAMLAAGCGRDTTVVALGGGVVGDLAGFVAATYMRGVPVVQVPTTLLAMVDASVGGKTAVDTPAGKNLVGAFHPPAAVLVDPTVLATLPAADRLAGAAEAVKHGVLVDGEYFRRVADLLPLLGCAPDHIGRDPAGWAASVEGVVARSVAIKASVVAHDEREGGMRKILNFGHTLGHALESESGFALRHGEAVAAGMALEARLAERLGVAEPGTATAVTAALTRGGLPTGRPATLDPEAVLAATRGDKKTRAGVVEYALPTRIGAMAECGGRWALPVPDALVREVLAPAWEPTA
ncbi:3-dehydroquinate synthase [Roseisolibacter sp. H3M3-2]|uniref:3-dehydroquinate synthase n=1 Tax=Roseisolibacter sp. H3M3-2 TaxID=3031323 RepID=UPI0023DC553C|nr:3-dehydroquinate synthase [Roseisolibacter sp. H3M3-2]MDF1503249.1 3-dehydroquinate synthase [Roseisolibacter sp. H3M3-2]